MDNHQEYNLEEQINDSNNENKYLTKGNIYLILHSLISFLILLFISLIAKYLSVPLFWTIISITIILICYSFYYLVVNYD